MSAVRDNMPAVTFVLEGTADTAVAHDPITMLESQKKEVAPDGSKDENILDIQQGVAICIMVKNPQGKVKGKRP